MRPVIRPSSIALAAGNRLSAVDGAGTPSIMNRLTAMADLLPFVASRSAVRGYHACDLIVTSRNPLLASLALHAAARAGMRPAVAVNLGEDLWPYDLAVANETGRIIAAALGIELPMAARSGVVEWLLERILSEISRSCPVIMHGITPGARNPDEEGAFFFGEEAVVHRPLDPSHAKLSAVFNRFMEGRPVLAPAREGRTVAFARHLILTGRPESFGTSTSENCLIRWPGPVSGFGSARWDLPTYPDAAKAMLEDVLTLARGLPATISAAALQARF